jgi:hypothetical protein
LMMVHFSDRLGRIFDNYVNRTILSNVRDLSRET